MKVKVTQDYNDSVLKKLVVKDTELEVTDDRGKVLIDSGVAVAITTTANANDPTPIAPKKGGRGRKKADE